MKGTSQCGFEVTEKILAAIKSAADHAVCDRRAQLFVEGPLIGDHAGAVHTVAVNAAAGSQE